MAARAGVSAMTVSRVLRGQHNLVSDETRARILEAVRDLDYVPVRAAMQNRHVETHVIGLVPYYINFPNNQLDALTYEGICRAARKQGYDLLVMLRDEADWMINRQEVRFLDRRSDGFIFISPGTGEWSEALQALKRHTIPSVVCYRRDVPSGVGWVDPDNDEIVRLAVEHLRSHGHRKIAYLTGATPASDASQLSLSGARHNYDDEQRRAAFTRLMQGGTPKKRGAFKAHYILSGATSDWRLDPNVLTQLGKLGVTGVVCINDLLALLLWDELEKQNWRVPHDLSIVGVDDSPQAAARGLSSVAFGYDEVGRLAIEAWLQLRSGKKAAQVSRVVPVHLVERTSVGPLPSRP